MATKTSRRRLQLSLFCRAVVAAGILVTFALAITFITALFTTLAAGYVIAPIAGSIDYLSTAPRLSVLLPISPVVAVFASLGLLILIAWAVSDRFVIPLYRSTGVVLVLLGLALGCLYVTTVEVIVFLTQFVSWSRLMWWAIFALGPIFAVWGVLAEGRDNLSRLRDQLLDGSDPATETYPALAETTTQLALQADVPSPTLRIANSDRPESFTLGSGTDAVIVVSTGLLDALTDEEVMAVLAHEISHLANADSRLMNASLVPVLRANEMIFDDDPDLFDRFMNWVIGYLKLYGQFGVAILARGREWHADAGAVALTGSPAALASALERLDSEREKPTTDLRDWEASITALDILPPSDWEHATGPFRTHPSTEKRIERLRQQVVDSERTVA